MYSPPYFSEADADGLTVVREAPFALLISKGADGETATTHLPIILDPDAEPGKPMLLGHIARANPHSKVLTDGTGVLAVFTGANAYISPNWYPSKHTGTQTVPTWNYLATHISGRIEALPNIADKRRCVTLLSERFEGDGPRAWRLDDEPEDFIRKMLGGIYAFRIIVDNIQAKAKLSQNRAQLDRAGVINGLQATERPSDFALAEAMLARGLDEESK
jgi:transcriptional regulator